MSSTDKPIRYAIYCHIHTESGRRYIGLTKKTMMYRWNQHVQNALKKRGKGCAHLWNAIRKYGKDAFTHEVLEVCFDLDQANLAEEWFIRLLKTCDPRFGFNLARGGDHLPHSIWENPWDRPEFREKALASLAKANSIPRETRIQRTKKLWEDSEFREKITEASRRAYSDPELINRVTEAMKAGFATPESKAKRSASSKQLWEDSKFRAKNANLWQNPEFRARCESGLKHGASLNASKTHCPNGHEYSPENTIINNKGSRECAECVRKSGRESARRIRARKAKERGPIIVTHCSNGHEYSPENTRMMKRGSRMCLTCMRKRSRERARISRQRASTVEFY